MENLADVLVKDYDASIINIYENNVKKTVKYIRGKDILKICNLEKLPKCILDTKMKRIVKKLKNNKKTTVARHYYRLKYLKEYLHKTKNNPSVINIQKRMGIKKKYNLKTQCIYEIINRIKEHGVINYKTNDITGSAIEVFQADYAYPHLKLLLVFRGFETENKFTINAEGVALLSELGWYVHEIYTFDSDFDIDVMITQLENIAKDQRIIYEENKSVDELYELMKNELSNKDSFAEKYGLKMLCANKKNPYQFELEDVLVNTLKVKKKSDIYKKVMGKFVVKTDNKESDSESDSESDTGSDSDSDDEFSLKNKDDKQIQSFIENKDYKINKKGKIMIGEYLFGILALITDNEKGKIIYDKLYKLKEKVVIFLDKRSKLKKMKEFKVNEVRLSRALELAGKRLETDRIRELENKIRKLAKQLEEKST